jgi:hypothetical protein
MTDYLTIQQLHDASITREDLAHRIKTLQNLDLEQVVAAILEGTGLTWKDIQANAGKTDTAPVPVLLIVLETVVARLFGPHTNAIHRMNPTDKSTGILAPPHGELAALSAAFIQYDGKLCEKLAVLHPTASLAPTSNVKSTLLAVIASIGLTPDILSTYLYACLTGTYVRPGSEADGQCRIGHRSPFSELGKDIPATMFREVQNFNDYITSMNQKLALFQTTWDKAGNCILTDESHRTIPYNMRDWKPTVTAMYEMLPFPKYMDSWELKTDGTLAEFCQSLLEAAQTTSKASKSTDAYMSARASDPTSGHTMPKEMSRTFAVTPKGSGDGAAAPKDGDRFGPWQYLAKEQKYWNSKLDSDKKHLINSKQMMDRTQGWFSRKHSAPMKCPACKSGDQNHTGRWGGCPNQQSAFAPTKGKGQRKESKKRSRSGQTCHHFAKYGNCKFGDECIHDHIRPSKNAKGENIATTAAITKIATDAAAAVLAASTKCVCSKKDEPGHTRSTCGAYAAMTSYQSP